MPDAILKQMYLDAQKQCGLEIGDKVRVKFRPEGKDYGWCNTWLAVVMDNCVGRTGIVTRITEAGITVEFAGKTHKQEFDFPYFVLGKICNDGFNVGDIVKIKDTDVRGHICEISNKDGITYATIQLSKNRLKYSMRLDQLEKIEQANEFNPFDKVLVRDNDDQEWKPKLFWKYNNCDSEYRYLTIDDRAFKQCVHYEENECFI